MELRGPTRRKGRIPLVEFVAQAWPSVDPAPFVPSRLIEELCTHLEATTDGDLPRLLINVPPSTGKSLTVSVLWPAWEWTFQPDKKIIACSYSLQLALDLATKMRDVVQSDWYQARWPLDMRQDVDAKGMFMNDSQGFRYSTSVGGPMTGKHADRIIVDDPHKPINITRPDTAEIRRSQDWYRGTLSSRKTDMARSTVTVIMQRLAENDLTGFLLEGSEGFEHLCLPMEYDPTRVASTSIGGDWRTEPGELLLPERFDVYALERLKAAMASPKVISAQLDQRPAPLEGEIFKAEWLQYWFDKPPTQARLVQSWDLSVKKTERGSFVAGGVAAVFKGEIYMLKVIRRRMGFVETLETLRQTLVEFPATTEILIEDKANGSPVIDALRADGVMGMIPIQPVVDKERRAEAVASFFQAGNVRFPREEHKRSWYHDLCTELLLFPSSATDDQVDMLTQLVQHVSLGSRQDIVRKFKALATKRRR